MKNFQSFLVIVGLLFSTSLAHAEDFRTTNWGMTQEQVRKLEKSTPIESKQETDGSIVLSTYDNIAGIPAMITYTFIDDKLVQGTTAFFKLSLDGSQNNAEYNVGVIFDALVKKYGEPLSTEAAAVGASKTSWQNANSDIILNLGNRDGKPFALVLYYSKSHQDLRMKTRENEIQKKF